VSVFKDYYDRKIGESVTFQEISLCLLKWDGEENRLRTGRLFPLPGRSYRHVREKLGITYSPTMRIYQDTFQESGQVTEGLLQKPQSAFAEKNYPCAARYGEGSSSGAGPSGSSGPGSYPEGLPSYDEIIGLQSGPCGEIPALKSRIDKDL
jgi:hypothetical protein